MPILDTTDDTIAAVSTPLGEGGIGIVRLSGRDAVAIADAMFRPRKGPHKGKTLKASKSHSITYGFVIDPETKEAVDEALFTVMRAPNTYTREDVVEINCHGGYVQLKRTLELAIKQGARPAGPGEFTKRAFLNGRIDLTQAEAVIDLIRARSERAGKVALGHLRGGLGKKMDEVRGMLIDISAQIEAHIDFPEEEIEPASFSVMESGIRGVVETLSGLLKTFDEGRLIREGVRAAIVGRPNVGKSSLLNALLEEDRAIVTEMPGTTRDVIEEHLSVKGLPVRIMDTAGIREAKDMVEGEGVKRSLRAIEDADIVIAVFDGSSPLQAEDMEILQKIKDKPSIVLLNKCDIWEAPAPSVGMDGRPALRASAKTGEGIEALKEALFSSCIKDGFSFEGVMLTNLRHKTAIEGAKKGLEAALRALAEKRPLEIVAIELREGIQNLSELTGAVTADDVLNRIFSEFCVGK